MADVEVTQGRVLVTAFDFTPAMATEVGQARVLTIYNVPTENLLVTQGAVKALVEPSLDIEVSQARVLAVVRGRIENRKLRAWGFSLDGHDFYVLRLGETETIIYDMSTGQWQVWDDGINPVWRAQVGTNWLGIGQNGYLTGAMSQVISGDHNYDIIWSLDPALGYDEHPVTEGEAIPFERKVTGGIPMRLRNTKKIGAAYLTAAVGFPQVVGAEITLRSSDDNGQTWSDHGTLTAEVDNYSQEFVWRSLGLVKAPGKIFEITDNGASVRLDSLDVR